MAIEATTTLPQSFHIGQRVQAHPAPLWMLRTLAMQQAKARVRDEIKRCGYKLSLYKAAEITDMAAAYLSQHHDELFARAEEIVAASAELQRMARRWEREQARRSNITSGAQRSWR
jgi:hypothetical protein